VAELVRYGVVLNMHTYSSFGSELNSLDRSRAHEHIRSRVSRYSVKSRSITLILDPIFRIVKLIERQVEIIDEVVS
jgi:hypothetical protein